MIEADCWLKMFMGTHCLVRIGEYTCNITFLTAVSLCLIVVTYLLCEDRMEFHTCAIPLLVVGV